MALRDITNVISQDRSRPDKRSKQKQASYELIQRFDPSDDVVAGRWTATMEKIELMFAIGSKMAIPSSVSRHLLDLYCCLCVLDLEGGGEMWRNTKLMHHIKPKVKPQKDKTN
mmetsp:Transcript_26273/g.39079  ORF Transcript_26273/g.39079 Transcript_26273/m.39079 type:complete len:113 (-) Transcript_26273:285-623(-)|eukprot:CAMPEP_0116009250 /NCGR_PEP_ID=MMETSP0321-20121206/3325_1 /TAXON_ID=163516 /ORGANISM="Leptocylindrus danicus var. danicus, Strain B650" /LENGTH=112 /DNA_ID=CAMNT_0003478185 /DNA_START=545 /DNA_END=883 /DNA_ORIENTATION=+